MSKSKPEGKRVGIWIRVSTEDQAAGESPQHHEFRARRYAEMNEWTVIETYDLAGVSGKSVWEHPECQRMLKDVKRGHIQGLIFSKLARLARNTKELLEFAQYFKTHNGALVSIEEKLDTSTPAGLLFYTMLGAIAQWEREEIASRLHASIATRAKLGKPLSGMVPYGFKWVDKKLQQVPEEAAIRRQIFELFLEHRRKGVVARKLNERGHRTREGNEFSDMQVHRLLVCPSARGQYQINRFKRTEENSKDNKPESDWGVVECAPIVSAEVFDQVNRIIEEQHKPRKRPGKKPVHTFAGLLKCGCGHKMYVYTRSPNYTCNKCKNKVGAQALDEIFIAALEDTFTDSGKMLAHIADARQRLAERQHDLSIVKEQLAAVKSEMKKAYDLYIAGGVDMEQFKTINGPLAARHTQLNEEIPRVEGELSVIQVTELSAAATITEARSLAALWPTLDTEGKQRLAATLCSDITVPTDPEAPIDITFTHTPKSSVSDETLNRLNSQPNLESGWTTRVMFELR